jgi:hypothetical protein
MRSGDPFTVARRIRTPRRDQPLSSVDVNSLPPIGVPRAGQTRGVLRDGAGSMRVGDIIVRRRGDKQRAG